MDARNAGWEGVDWSHLADIIDQWQVLIGTVVNLKLP
jgi:hypothetical protein